jgi:multidrug transporter EmrE-like cation transporter
MVVIFSIVVALLIVCGQALWKAAVSGVVQKHAQVLSAEGLSQLCRSPRLYLGVLVYGIATIGYILLLSKYKYFQVQSIVVGGSLVITFLVAQVFFHEQAGPANLVGVLLILVGATLIVR